MALDAPGVPGASETLGRTRRSAPPRSREARGSDLRGLIGVLTAAALAVVAWLPFLDRPLSPDEGGFLLIAQQWHPETSLYGSYWVDRPPLLLWLFSLAAHLGPIGHAATGVTAPTVKLLGAVASGLTVLLAGLVAQVVSPGIRWTRTATLVGAVALLSNPLLGMPEANGEVLALPFVLTGAGCLVAATRRPWGRDALLLTAAAGASGMAAALVKQNVVDVYVFALILFLASRRRLPGLGHRVWVFLASGAAVLGAALAAAAVQGTTPTGLWDATVRFRLQASATIRSSASATTPERLLHLGLAALASGVAVLLAIACLGALRHTRGARGSRGPLVWAALGLAAWELCAVALGGSYWLHYLTGLVPGALLLVMLAPASGPSRALVTGCLAYVVLASAVVWGQQAAAPGTVSDDGQVATYLRGHSDPADGVVVAFGHPDIVAASGLHSPYEQLWSLPVRVRDPRLTELGAVLTGPAAPRWVVVAGGSLDSWGLQATSTQQVLEDHYVERTAYGDWHVWQHRPDGSGP